MVVQRLRSSVVRCCQKIGIDDDDAHEKLWTVRPAEDDRAQAAEDRHGTETGQTSHAARRSAFEGERSNKNSYHYRYRVSLLSRAQYDDDGHTPAICHRTHGRGRPGCALGLS